MVSAMRLLKPPAVAEGAGISVIAPASFALPERVARGLAALRELGYRPKLDEQALNRGPLYFAGSAEQRLAELHAAFANQSTSAVMCLRGGYGSNYLLGGLDLELIARHPKPLFAYSDLTGLQLRLLDRLGLPAFHGPMAAADFYLEDGVHWESFRAALEGERYSVGAAEGLRALRPGTAHGRLYGGCLSILVSLLGTPWEPRSELRAEPRTEPRSELRTESQTESRSGDTLLFLEDIGVKPYQIDRMLWQLRQAGKLEGVRGIVFGEMVNCVSAGAAPELVEEAILSALEGFDGPIAIGLRSGHVSRQNVTLTLGVEAELTVGDETRLDLLEAAVETTGNEGTRD